MKIMETRWRDFIENDPYYSPNLTKVRGDYSLPVMDHTLDIRQTLQRELLRDPVFKKQDVRATS